MPENEQQTNIPYSGTVGEFIPRPLAAMKALGLKSSVSHSNPSSPNRSPKGGMKRKNSYSPKLSRKSSFSNDSDTHVGGVLTFIGRVIEVMEGLFPGSPVMMELIQLMNTRWWDKCSDITYVADHLTLVSILSERERASRIWKALQLTFLFLLPLSNLFHCLCHVSPLL